jgi:hypothetical protein
MSRILDSTDIGSISIPGTHDAATAYTNLEAGVGYVKCQDLSINDQLIHGIRYLDIRLRPIDDDLIAFHGTFQLDINFDQILKIVTSFLQTYKTETVLMRIRHENNEPTDAQKKRFLDKFNLLYNKYKQFFWTYADYNDENPILGHVRGKIVIIQNFEGPTVGLSLNKFNLQDYAEVDSVNAKDLKILIKYNEAVKGQRKVINHLSGYKITVYTPGGLASLTNPFMRDLILKNNPSYVGIVPADFPYDDLILSIIRANLHWNTDNTANYVWTLSCDFPGNDLISLKIRDVECGPKCNQDSRCTHFTYNIDSGTCFLKSGAVSQYDAIHLSSKKNAYSLCGIVKKNLAWIQTKFFTDNSDIYIRASSCDFPRGNNLISLKIRDSECSQNCNQDSRCTHFVYNRRLNTCFLKYGVVSRNDAINFIDRDIFCGITGTIL